jgi:hypothetical protein
LKRCHLQDVLRALRQDIFSSPVGHDGVTVGHLNKLRIITRNIQCLTFCCVSGVGGLVLAAATWAINDFAEKSPRQTLGQCADRLTLQLRVSRQAPEHRVLRQTFDSPSFINCAVPKFGSQAESLSISDNNFIPFFSPDRHYRFDTDCMQPGISQVFV